MDTYLVGLNVTTKEQRRVVAENPRDALEKARKQYEAFHNMKNVQITLAEVKEKQEGIHTSIDVLKDRLADAVYKLEEEKDIDAVKSYLLGCDAEFSNLTCIIDSLNETVDKIYDILDDGRVPDKDRLKDIRSIIEGAEDTLADVGLRYPDREISQRIEDIDRG